MKILLFILIVLSSTLTLASNEKLIKVGETIQNTTYVTITPSIIGRSRGKPYTFLMGSPNNENIGNPDNNYVYEHYRDEDERLHKVHLTKKFEIMAHEITVRQWANVMGHTKFTDKCKHFSYDDVCPVAVWFPTGGFDWNHPVDNVSYYDVEAFIKKLNKQDKKWKYRLPTEAEWEYAARGKTTTAYSFSFDPNGYWLNMDGLDDPLPARGHNDSSLNEMFAWTAHNSENATHVVTLKKTNKYELHDMHGNVWEWVYDAYKKNYSKKKDIAVDPKGPGKTYRNFRAIGFVIRGGAFNTSVPLTRSANRLYQDGSIHLCKPIGFRLIRSKK